MNLANADALRPKAQAELLIAAMLLLALFGQAVIGSVRLSLTTDEPMHTAMGYTSLALSDYRLLPVHIHPPLINSWAAWPLLLRPDRPDPRQVPGWEEGNLFKFSAQLLLRLGPIEAVELAVRVPIALLSVLLGALVYRWATDLFGGRGGLLALFLYAFDPGIVSSSQLNTTDIGVLAFGVLATFAAWRATHRSTPKLIVLVGLALGGAAAAKVSGLFFVPMVTGLVGVTLVYANWGLWGVLGRQVLQWGARFLLIYLLAFGVVWAAYRFELKPLPDLGFPVPAASHWLVLQAFNKHIAEGHPAFLAGQVSQYGWWWYFPFAFVVKTPVPTLLLLTVAVIGWLCWRRKPWTNGHRASAEIWLLAIPGVYFINAMFSTIDIGYRHLVPALPFLFIFTARLVAPCTTYRVSRIPVLRLLPFPPGASCGCGSEAEGTYPCPAATAVPARGVLWMWKRSRRNVSRITYHVLLLWYLVGAVRIFPYYLAYFNELAGGPDGGYRYLVDSNTDWGQALKDLAAYQRAEGIEQVRLSMFTFIDPAIYGVRYEPLTPLGGNTPAIFPSRFNPPPGDYVISTTALQGIPLADPEMFDWFRKRQPDARIGHVMFAYRVETVRPRTWVAQCASPVAPLEVAQIAEGFGRTDLRLAYFDCAQSWLYPTGGKSPGWLILPATFFELEREAPRAWTWPGMAHLAGVSRLSYEQKRAGVSPPFRIYEADALRPADEYALHSQTDAKRLRKQARVAPSEVGLVDALAMSPVDLPVSFEGGLTLLGYALERPALKPGEMARLVTTWRVDGNPGRLLSLMAHVVGLDERVVAVGDGLGVPIESWQPDDVFVQQHKLALPGDMPPGEYWVQTGVYWLDSGKRWPVQNEDVMGDRVLLMPLEIQK